MRRPNKRASPPREVISLRNETNRAFSPDHEAMVLQHLQRRSNAEYAESTPVRFAAGGQSFESMVEAALSAERDRCRALAAAAQAAQPRRLLYSIDDVSSVHPPSDRARRRLAEHKRQVEAEAQARRQNALRAGHTSRSDALPPPPRPPYAPPGARVPQGVAVRPQADMEDPVESATRRAIELSLRTNEPMPVRRPTPEPPGSENAQQRVGSHPSLDAAGSLPQPNARPASPAWEISDFSYESLLDLGSLNASTGLSRAQLAKLPSRTYQGETVDCSICLDDVVAGNACMTLACKHVFHARCILSWLARTNRCPTCRYEIVRR